MGFLDFFNDEQQENTPRIKETPWGAENRNYLTSLINQNVQYPTQQIAGLSDAEKQVQTLLAQVMSGSTFQDPRTSPYYQGLRQEIGAETEKGVSALNRRAQSAGMYRSGTAARAEGDYRSDQANKQLSLLGSLYEQERARDNPYTRLQAGATYGALPRELEQAGLTSQYQQQVNQLQFPYQYQAPLAQNMLNYQPWYTPTYITEPSEYSRINNAVQGIAGWGGDIASMMAVLSDSRLKNNITYVNGGPWATWTWNKTAGDLFGLKGVSCGLIAQDVEQWNPAAIRTHASGYKMIDYSMI